MKFNKNHSVANKLASDGHIDGRGRRAAKEEAASLPFGRSFSGVEQTRCIEVRVPLMYFLLFAISSISVTAKTCFVVLQANADVCSEKARTIVEMLLALLRRPMSLMHLCAD